MKDMFKKSGYDLEEAYFHKLNLELIANLKAQRSMKLKTLCPIQRRKLGMTNRHPHHK